MIFIAPPHPNLATLAVYSRYGLEANIFTQQEVVDWAYSIVESLETPPCEIMEVATSRSRLHLIECLNQVEGERDVQLAGHWLLCLLKQKLQSAASDLFVLLKQAMQISISTNQSDEEYFTFSGIDDQLNLAVSGTYGTVGDYRQAFEKALGKYQQSAVLQMQ